MYLFMKMIKKIMYYFLYYKFRIKKIDKIYSKAIASEIIKMKFEK